MSEELNLVKDLAIILMSAGIFTIICKALKQPSILGYIIAGFLISPNLGLFGISNMETVEQWSEIGVIFLMFGLGLEFSFKKLIAVGVSALTIAGSKFLGTFVIGFTVGQAIGWSTMESIFLAGLLSMSSTAVIIKSYDELGLKQKPFAGMVFGSLVVEDLLAILMMVLLPTIAVAGKFEGGAMLFNLVKLAFFLILWFLVGIYVIPTLLKRFKAYINDEILLVVSIGLCFAMVTLANAVGLSSALGAFVIGSILSETIESERIEHLISPIKELFGAIFFVSVGMMIAPSVIVEHWSVILILTLVVLISDSIFAATGVLLSGGGLKNALPAGLSLAQLGEFGFILVSVGISLGVMREFIYPVIVAVSVITIFLSPYMIKLATPIYNLLQKKLPQNWLDRIDNPVQEDRSAAEKGEWKKLLQAYFIRIVLYGVILIAIVLLANVYLSPMLTKLFPSWSEGAHNWVMVVATLVIMAPFLYGLGVSPGSINESANKLIQEKKGNLWPIFGLTLLRIFIALGFVLSVISSHIKLSGWAVLAILVTGLILLLFGRKYLRRYNAIERQFLENLNDKERAERARKPISTSIKKQLARTMCISRNLSSLQILRMWGINLRKSPSDPSLEPIL